MIRDYVSVSVSVRDEAFAQLPLISLLCDLIRLFH